jgi:hypothetical protein
MVSGLRIWGSVESWLCPQAGENMFSILNSDFFSYETMLNFNGFPGLDAATLD